MIRTASLFFLPENAIMRVEEYCLARYTPWQGGEGAISDALPDGNCDRIEAASGFFEIIGAASCCPCIFCRGIAEKVN